MDYDLKKTFRQINNIIISYCSVYAAPIFFQNFTSVILRSSTHLAIS